MNEINISTKLSELRKEKGVTQDVELSADDLKELARQFKEEYKAKEICNANY